MSVPRQSFVCAIHAASAWEALVEGRWRLHDLGTIDGRQAYALIEVPTNEWDRRRLSRLEARVLQRYSQGVPGKDVAYTLGLSESTVSTAMRGAGAKLGIDSRAALIQLAALLLGTGLVAPIHLLTGAETDVLRQLARGRTNSEIAASRGSSMCTVANQVAAVMQKLGLPSRSAAAALAVFQPTLSWELVSDSAVA